MSLRNVLSVFVFLIFGFVVGYFAYKNIYKIPPSMEFAGKGNEYIQQDVPFKELTIPFLRSRSYSSKIGEMQVYKKSANYTSYLTSYDSDGLKINGLLTVPNGDTSKKHPAIVFVHGYIAPTIYKTTEKYVEYVDYLARNGYVVFKIDLRGHGGSEGEATGSYYSGDYVVDTINAYKALESAEFVDKDNIGLWGHSMAGNITLRTAAVLKNIPATAIWAGAGFTYSDLLKYRISDNSYRPPEQNTQRSVRREELRNIHGDFDPNSDFWKLVPGANYLSDFTGAVGIFHSVDDAVVSVEYSRNLKHLLDEERVENEYHEYSSGGHNISGSNFGRAMQTTVNFFDKFLK